jgi:hypothetical protein
MVYLMSIEIGIKRTTRTSRSRQTAEPAALRKLSEERAESRPLNNIHAQMEALTGYGLVSQYVVQPFTNDPQVPKGNMVIRLYVLTNLLVWDTAKFDLRSSNIG